MEARQERERELGSCEQEQGAVENSPPLAAAAAADSSCGGDEGTVLYSINDCHESALSSLTETYRSELADHEEAVVDDAAGDAQVAVGLPVSQYPGESLVCLEQRIARKLQPSAANETCTGSSKELLEISQQLVSLEQQLSQMQPLATGKQTSAEAKIPEDAGQEQTLLSLEANLARKLRPVGTIERVPENGAATEEIVNRESGDCEDIVELQPDAREGIVEQQAGAYAVRSPMSSSNTPSRVPNAIRSQIGSVDTSSSVLAESQNAGLVEARPVSQDEPEAPLDLEDARPMDNIDPDRRGLKEFVERNMCGIAVLASCLLGLLVMIAILLANRTQEENSISSGHEGYQSATPENPPESVREYLRNILDTPHIQDDNSTMSALQWLEMDPKVYLYHPTQLHQRFALATFYAATNGEQWDRNSDWLRYDRHECDWETDTVLHLFGQSSHEENTSPCLARDEGVISDEISPALHIGDNSVVNHKRVYERLWLTYNNLNGTIPEGLCRHLPSLKSLGLLFNANLIGTFPLLDDVGNYSTTDSRCNPTQISLSFTGIYGTIPTEIGLLSSLELVYLAKYLEEEEVLETSQVLHGSLPSELGLLNNLEHLFLTGNALEGSLPTELFLATGLDKLGVSFNNISGQIPSEIGLLTRLRFLGASGNQLSGTLPSELGLSTSLEFVYWYQNRLTGHIPPQLGNLTNLKELFLAENQLSGAIPEGRIWSQWTNLVMMFLSHNEGLNGTLDTQALASHHPKLLALDINRTSIHLNTTGSIPQSVQHALQNTFWKYLYECDRSLECLNA